MQADEQVEGCGVIVTSRLFDQAVLVVGRVYDSTGYQSRLNILSALTDNNTKVKKILREGSFKLDDVGNQLGSFQGKIDKNNQCQAKIEFKGSQHLHILVHILAPYLKKIKEVRGVECSSHVETKEAQVFSPQLPKQKVEIFNLENFPKVHQVVKNLTSPSKKKFDFLRIGRSQQVICLF